MSNTVDYADLNVGDQIPDMVKENISRTQLALFAGASGDHNPIHLDDEEAKSGGLPGVIVHGFPRRYNHQQGCDRGKSFRRW